MKWETLRSKFETGQILAPGSKYTIWSLKDVVLGFTIKFSIFRGYHLFRVACTILMVRKVSMAIFYAYQGQINLYYHV
jgi:hypothetical protein